jgi:peptide deformylase
VSVRRVVRLGRPVLRRVAKPVSRSDLKTGRLDHLIDDLADTMHDYNGVGIAAPQVDVSVRLFVVEVHPDKELSPDLDEFPLTVFANPEVTYLGDRDHFSPEGCLSLPDLAGIARRYSRLKVKALDRRGKPFTLELKDYPAIVVQHELDHLNGHLYIDRLWSQASLGYAAEVSRFGSLKRETLDSVTLQP